MITVFDASAVLALLRGERGADEAGRHLDNAALSAINLCEVLQRLTPDFSEPAARLAVASLGLAVVAAGEADALEAARLNMVTYVAGLSIADRFCLALAKRLSAPAITADREWSRVADAVGVKVIQIRQ